MIINQKALDLFNNLSGVLYIKGGWMSTGTKLEVELSLPELCADYEYRTNFFGMGAHSETTGLFRHLSEDELNIVVFEDAYAVYIKNQYSHTLVRTTSSSGLFTIGSLWGAVELAEQMTRHEKNWMGGEDHHHVYFEGIKMFNGVPSCWESVWGS